jgi:hypothetical protein
MNVYITTSVSNNLLSVEDKSLPYWWQTQWETINTSPLITGTNAVCTQQVFDAIKDNVGTIHAPALIANSSATPVENRQNVYIENGSLKLLAQ